MYNKAKRCQRCGAYYEENYYAIYSHNEIAYDVTGITFINKKSGTPISETIDLCDHCINSLLEFLNKKEV